MSGTLSRPAFYDDEEEHALLTMSLLQKITRKRRRLCKHSGSRKGRSKNLERESAERYQRFNQLYWARRPVYTPEQFRRRFRMSRELFFKIADDLASKYKYFTHRRDACGKLGHHPYMKLTAALRTLAYGCAADSLDETLEMAESTVLEATDNFADAVIAEYSDHYLRLPTEEDLQRLLTENAARGFPGMIGSIDCMKWVWKNCPSGWRGAFKGVDKKPTVVLEAIASYDLHIWHCFLGTPGSLNDINVLDASPLIAELCSEDAPRFSYVVNGREYKFLYWLADGIYPEWRCFVKTISAPIGEAQEAFTAAQESLRKDIERAFGVLQARFAIVARPARTWKLEKLNKIMKCCVILHNMIVQDDRESGRLWTTSPYAYSARTERETDHTFQFSRLEPESSGDRPRTFIERYQDVINAGDHYALKRDLIQHVYQRQQRDARCAQ